MQDDRPLTGNTNGQYNLDFVDWTGEFERILHEGTLDYYMDRERGSGSSGSSEDQQIDESEFEFKEEKKLPKSIKKKLKKMKMGRTKRTCAICIQGFEKDQVIYKLPCGHIFHKHCLDPWFEKKSTCPICRLDLVAHFGSDSEEEMDYEEDGDDVDYN